MLTFLISLEELRTHTHAKNRENLAGLQTHWKRRKNARANHASHHESPEEQPRPQGFAHLFREKPLGVGLKSALALHRPTVIRRGRTVGPKHRI